MNPSSTGGRAPKPALPDSLKLLAGAVVCGALALAILPLEPLIMRACNVHPMSSALRLWEWFDRSAPAVILTVAIVSGAAMLLSGRPRSFGERNPGDVVAGASSPRGVFWRDDGDAWPAGPGPGASRARRAGIALLVGLAATQLATSGIKSWTGRLRPIADGARAGPLWSPLDLKDDRSFPSGHVSTAAAIAAGFWLAGRRGRIRNAVWALPAMMMADRVCLAVHWPSDVLGGTAIGLGLAAGAAVAARFSGVARLLGILEPRGSPYARFALVTITVLALTRVWLELPLGRDPVGGQVVPGFETRPQALRIWLEPFVGPPLHLALEDPRRVALPLAGWAAAGILAIALASRARRVPVLTVAVLLPAAWIAVFLLRAAPPDAFVAEERSGVFVDWHLHGGDPIDGGIDAGTQAARALDRNVKWPVLTWHSATGGPLIVETKGLRSDVARGIAGMEWSGAITGSMRRDRRHPWETPHVLILGGRGELAQLEPAGASLKQALRAAAQAEALVIPAHYWRSQGSVPGCPTFEDLIAGGVHGFEVGNRRRETDAEALARLREIDRQCRARGLLRFSFSDDHGIPSGSPCVTFLEGVDEEALAAAGGLNVITRLRTKRGGGITPIPLLFHPGDPTLVPPDWLAPPVMAFEYFRSLRMPQRLSWLGWAALLGLWIFRVRPGRVNPTLRS